MKGNRKPDFSGWATKFGIKCTDGRTILRANPLVQEYRALIKDFSAALKAYQEITGDSGQETSNKLDGLRSKFKVAT